MNAREYSSFFRHFWHLTLAGVALEGPRLYILMWNVEVAAGGVFQETGTHEHAKQPGK